MTDSASRQGEFSSWQRGTDRREKFLESLIKLLKNYLLAEFSVNLEINLCNKVNAQYRLAERFYSPFALCGYALVGQAQEWATRRGDDTKVKFIFEDGDEGQGRLVELCKELHVVPEFKPKSKAVPCQAADLIAWKTRIGCCNAIKKPQVTLGSEINPELHTLQEMFRERDSLMNVMVSDVEPRVFSHANLVDVCKKFGIASRSM